MRDADRSRRCPRRPLDRAPQRRGRARGADQPRLRGRHDGDRRPVARCSRPSTTRAIAAHRRRRGHAGRPRPTSRTATPTAAASTSRSPAKTEPDDRDALLPRGVGRRHARRARAPAARSATTTASGSTAAGSSPTRSARPSTSSSAHEGGARPERHPQPGQARPAVPVRTLRLRVGRARDHPRHRRGHQQPARRARYGPTPPSRSSEQRELLPDSPAAGLVEFDAR